MAPQAGVFFSLILEIFTKGDILRAKGLFIMQSDNKMYLSFLHLTKKSLEVGGFLIDFDNAGENNAR